MTRIGRGGLRPVRKEKASIEAYRSEIILNQHRHYKGRRCALRQTHVTRFLGAIFVEGLHGGSLVNATPARAASRRLILVRLLSASGFCHEVILWYVMAHDIYYFMTSSATLFTIITPIKRYCRPYQSHAICQWSVAFSHRKILIHAMAALTATSAHRLAKMLATRRRELARSVADWFARQRAVLSKPFLSFHLFRH